MLSKGSRQVDWYVGLGWVGLLNLSESYQKTSKSVCQLVTDSLTNLLTGKDEKYFGGKTDN